MSVISEALHHVPQLHVVESVRHHLLVELLPLLNGGELSIDQKESDFQESRLFSKFFYGIPSVLKNPLVSVDERDLRDLNEWIRIYF